MHRLALGLACLCLATAAGCGRDELEVPESQRAVADDITSRGGLLGVDTDNPDVGVVSVNLQGTNAVDALVGRLSAFPELKALILRNTKITDAAVPALLKMDKLIQLDVGDTALTEKAKAALRGMFAEIGLAGAEEPVESEIVAEVTE